MPEPVLRYGWRPGAVDRRWHCVLPTPAGPTPIAGHHVAPGWCGTIAHLGHSPHLDTHTWAYCLGCAPGSDRFAVLAAIASAEPEWLTSLDLFDVQTDEPLEALLDELVLGGRLTEQVEHRTVLYRLARAEVPLWRWLRSDPGRIDVDQLTSRQRLGMACVWCAAPLDPATRRYVPDHRARNLYRCPTCTGPHGGSHG